MRTQKSLFPIAEAAFRRILECLHDGVYVLDRDRRIVYWNKGAERLTGYSAEEVLNHSCASDLLVHVDEQGACLCDGKCPMQATMVDGVIREAEVFMLHKEGHRVPVAVRAAPLLDVSGEIQGAVEIFTENSTRVAMAKENRRLRELALIDELTNTANRRYCEERLENALSEFERHGRGFGVLILDIDNFKQFNDRHGHETGDQVLRVVARTLKEAVRSHDLIGRWGGEEFLGIITMVDDSQLAKVGEKLRALVRNSRLSTPELSLRVTTSVGGATARPGDTVGSILMRADRALYESKRNGRNRVSIAGVASNKSVPHDDGLEGHRFASR